MSDTPSFLEPFFNFLEANFKYIVFTVIGAILIGVGYTGYTTYQESKEKEAQAKLYSIQKNIQNPDQPEGATEKESQISDFQKILDEYPKTQASAMAQIEIAKLHTEDNKLDAAIVNLESALKTLDKNNLLYGITKLHLGSLLLKKDDCKKAISNFENIVTHAQLDYLHGEALLKKGLCYEKMGEVESAKTTYTRVKQDFAGTSFADSATKYLNLLSLSTPSGT